MVDILEQSVLALVSRTGTHDGEKESDKHVVWNCLREMVQCGVSFFYTIQYQASCNHGGASNKNKTSFSSILSDAERTRSFLCSCKTVLRFDGGDGGGGFSKTIEDSARLQARVMIQALLVDA